MKKKMSNAFFLCLRAIAGQQETFRFTQFNAKHSHLVAVCDVPTGEMPIV